MDLLDFLETLKEGDPLETQCENLLGETPTSPNNGQSESYPATYGGVSIRQQLHIKSFPTTNSSALLCAASPIGTRNLLNGDYIHHQHSRLRNHYAEIHRAAHDRDL